MGEARRKGPRPDISVLIPYREKPDMLAACVKSLLATDDLNIEVLVAFDRDDETRGEALKILIGPEYVNLAAVEDIRFKNSPDKRLHCFLWDRPPSLGEKLNTLARHALADTRWFLAQDYTVSGTDWPDRIRQAVKDTPQGLSVLFPKDALHPDHSSFPILTRAMEEIAGFFMPPWFPYWFVDTWWDEVGILSGQHKEINLEVKHQGERGKSHGLVDLPFWVDFFEATRPLRASDAAEIIEKVGNPITPMPQLIETCKTRAQRLQDPVFLMGWQINTTGKQSEHYPELKAAAEKLMTELKPVNEMDKKRRPPRVAVCIPSTDSWKSRTAASMAALFAYSAMCGLEMCILNIEGSMISNSRNSTVQGALAERCDWLLWIDSDIKFPPDSLVRLLRHGKDIVGATYNKKTPPYETLGRFAGELPPDGLPAEGLWPALLLPGGMMLVKAEVYKKLGWPWYFESYRWPGGSGLQAFKDLLKDYFRDRPSDEVINSLDGTELGHWLQNHYFLGESGEPNLYWSEDLNFCRKARKEGYALFCDIGLTHDIAHIGAQEVTCDRPPAKEVAEAAE